MMPVPELMKAHPKMNFVDHNIEMTGLLNTKKCRYGSNLARTRLLKLNREPETFEQNTLLTNLESWENQQKAK